MTPALEFRNVTKRFGARGASVWALAGVSLSVTKGETLGVVGESGSGKSTLARIAVGLEAQTTGEAYLMGRPVTRDSVAGQIQMVFQDPASSLDPLLRVLRSVCEPLDVDRGTTFAARRERAMEALQEVGIGSESGTRYPAEFSGGQKQRVSIARALSKLPPVLVCDEAVTALDVSIRAQILNLLRRVQSEHGTACMFISHDLCTVAYMSDRIVVMYLGKVMEVGLTQQLFHQPAHPYTCALLSAVPKMQQGTMSRPRIRLLGDPPSVSNPPTGCRFHTRCPLMTERCRAEEPPLVEISPGQLAACHYAPVDQAEVARAAKEGRIRP